MTLWLQLPRSSVQCYNLALVMRREMSSEQKRLKAIVHGYVQGVGFRYRTREVARRLNLSGYVRNQPDRTVEVVAEGSERALRELLAYLREGPSAASVNRVDETWLPSHGEFSGFQVRF
jgi:acylphosphatase